MFSSLMPQRKEFFELLSAHAEEVVAGANAALRLINGLGDASVNLLALVDEVNQHEQKGDQIKAKVIERLHQSFTTPINRDQIHSLISPPITFWPYRRTLAEALRRQRVSGEGVGRV